MSARSPRSQELASQIVYLPSFGPRTACPLAPVIGSSTTGDPLPPALLPIHLQFLYQRKGRAQHQHPNNRREQAGHSLLEAVLPFPKLQLSDLPNFELKCFFLKLQRALLLLAGATRCRYSGSGCKHVLGVQQAGRTDHIVSWEPAPSSVRWNLQHLFHK